MPFNGYLRTSFMSVLLSNTTTRTKRWREKKINDSPSSLKSWSNHFTASPRLEYNVTAWKWPVVSGQLPVSCHLDHRRRTVSDVTTAFPWHGVNPRLTPEVPMDVGWPHGSLWTSADHAWPQEQTTLTNVSSNGYFCWFFFFFFCFKENKGCWNLEVNFLFIYFILSCMFKSKPFASI